MQILNVDSLAQVRRKLRMDGQDHDVLETSVQDFVNNLKAAEDLESAAAQGKLEPRKMSVEVVKAIDSIVESVPTISRESLLKKPHFVLVEILRFIRGELDPMNSDAKAADQEGGAEKKD